MAIVQQVQSVHVSVSADAGSDEFLIELAMYFRNWHMFREYMNNITC